MWIWTRRVAGPVGPARRVARKPQSALVPDPAVLEVATVVDEVGVAVHEGPDAAQLVQTPYERLSVRGGEPFVFEVQYRYSMREVVPRIGVEELRFRHSPVRAHEVVEAPWLSVVYAPLHPLVAASVHVARALGGLHDVEVGIAGREL